MIYITNTICKDNPMVTNSGFPAVTITLPEIQKVPEKDLFTLPVINPVNQIKPLIKDNPEKQKEN